MKLWQCAWVPSSVADWLCKELDERGIPGTTYTHILLSFLHPYFCPHPSQPLADPPTKVEKFQTFINVKEGKHLKQQPHIEDFIHPDADFPQLVDSQALTEENSDTTKLENNLECIISSEEGWKSAALQCLLDASNNEKPKQLQHLIEELFDMLKRNDSSNLKEKIEKLNFIECDRKCDFIECPSSLQQLDCMESTKSSSLSSVSLNLCNSDQSIIGQSAFNWKSLIENNLSPDKGNLYYETPNSPKLSNLADQLSFDATQLTPRSDAAEPSDLLKSFSSHNLNVKSGLEMEISPNSMEEEEAGENEGSRFVPIYKANSHECNRDGQVSNENDFCNLVRPLAVRNASEDRRSHEEWEGTATVVGQSEGQPAVGLDSMGNRLFERGSMADHRQNEELSGSFAFQNGSISLSDSSTSAVSDNSPWEAPTKLKRDYGTVGSWKSTNINSDEISAPLLLNVNSSTSLSQTHLQNFRMEDEQFQPRDEATIPYQATSWSQDQKLNSDPQKCGTEFYPIFNCEPTDISFKRGVGPKNVQRQKEKGDTNIWSDMNDNITLNNESNYKLSHGLPNRIELDELYEDKESKLCNSFNHLGLEHIWNPKVQIEKDKSFAHMTNTEFFDHLLNGKNIDEKSKCTYAINQDVEVENISNKKTHLGPNGPYADLGHTHSSGFCTVVPHSKQTRIEVNPPVGAKTEPFTDLSLPKKQKVSPQDDLYTSPRTHFRPIRQDSQESDEDVPEACLLDRSETVASDSSPQPLFERSESDLYLEKDLVCDSTKNYVYRDPAPESFADVNKDVFKPLTFDSSHDSWEQGGKMKSLWSSESEALPSLADDENLVGSSWPLRPLTPLEESQQFFSNWSLQSQRSKFFNDSSVDEDIDRVRSDLQRCFPSVSTAEGLKANSMDANGIEGSNESDAYSRIKFIWGKPQEEGDLTERPNSPPDANGSMTWKDSLLPTTSSLVIPKEPWYGKEASSTRDSLADFGSAETYSTFAPLVLNATNDGIRAAWSSAKDGSGSQWQKQMQWEVDQEAEELLGGLVLPPELSPPGPTAIIDNAAIDYGGYDALSGEVPPQIEDLDNLEWDLNEGFEWGPENVEMMNEQSYEAAEDSGPDMMYCQTSEGHTVAVPIEYFDPSIYDEIFGSADAPIGGSMPDLPAGSTQHSNKLLRRVRGHSGDRDNTPPWRRPCTFFLEGNCPRSDCKYSHDLLAITCRFWQEGSCLKGETCPFRHSFAPALMPRRRNRSEGDQVCVTRSNNLLPLRATAGNRHKHGKDGGSSSRGKPIPVKRSSRNGASAASASNSDGGGRRRASVTSFEIESKKDFPTLSSSVESMASSVDEQYLSINVKNGRLSKRKKKISFSKSSNTEVDTNTESQLKAAKCKGGSGTDSSRRRQLVTKDRQKNSYEDGTVSDF